MAQSEFTVTYSEPNNSLAMMASTLNYTCYDGYFVNNGSETLTCGGTETEHAYWMGGFPLCPSEYINIVSQLPALLAYS